MVLPQLFERLAAFHPSLRYVLISNSDFYLFGVILQFRFVSGSLE